MGVNTIFKLRLQKYFSYLGLYVRCLFLFRAGSCAAWRFVIFIISPNLGVVFLIFDLAHPGSGWSFVSRGTLFPGEPAGDGLAGLRRMVCCYFYSLGLGWFG